MVSMTGNNGWVIVTSRAGSPLLWSRMKFAQNLVLQPLSEEDAAGMLWRMKESIDTRDASDYVIKGLLEDFKKDNPVEYRALLELCGSDWNFGLAGLPLALAQAGAYIRHRRCSFSKYLQLYREASMMAKLSYMLRKTEEFASVREE